MAELCPLAFQAVFWSRAGRGFAANEGAWSFQLQIETLLALLLLLDADAIKRDPALGPGSTHSVDSTRLSTLPGLGWGSSFLEEGIDLYTVSYGWNVIVLVHSYQWKKILVCTVSTKLFLNISFAFSKNFFFICTPF